jgi:hypothetical protein
VFSNGTLLLKLRNQFQNLLKEVLSNEEDEIICTLWHFDVSAVSFGRTIKTGACCNTTCGFGAPIFFKLGV